MTKRYGLGKNKKEIKFPKSAAHFPEGLKKVLKEKKGIKKPKK